MTPQDKAKELVERFKDYSDPNYHECAMEWELTQSIKDNAKECALIAVDEILNISYFEEGRMSEDDSLYKNYWLHVKTEINRL